jgi:hypothetical protein
LCLFGQKWQEKALLKEKSEIHQHVHPAKKKIQCWEKDLLDLFLAKNDMDLLEINLTNIFFSATK